MDFFTFIVIAFMIYSFFSKKDKPPQRTQRSAEDIHQPNRPMTEARGNREIIRPERKKKESIFENLERQIRESAERLEQELQGKPAQPKKTYTKGTARKQDTRTAMEKQQVEGVEGAWGSEGRSDYDSRRTTEGYSNYDTARTTEGYSDYDTYRTTEGVGSEELIAAQRQAKQQKTAQKQAPVAEPVLVSPSQMAVGETRVAGILRVSPSPIVQGIIWSEVLKEPKGRRGLMRR